MLCVMGGGPRQVTILNTVTPYQDRIREKLLGVELLLFKYYCHPRRTLSLICVIVRVRDRHILFPEFNKG